MKKRKWYLVMAFMVLFLPALFAGGKQTGSDSTARIPVKPSGQYPIANETVTISVLLGHVPQISDMIDNNFTRWMEQKLGIKLDITLEEANQGSMSNTKRELLFNTGDYPELILYQGGNSTADVSKYGLTEHIYIPLEPYLDTYGQNVVKTFNRFPGMKEGYTAPDGHIYSLGAPVETTVFHENAARKMWINTAWLQRLGLKMPVTTDEFYNVLKAFKARDPNGNGRADEIPLTGAINTWNAEPYQFLINSFTYWVPTPYGPIKLSRGQITGTADTAGFREGLRFCRQLFAEGLYDPAAFTQNEAQLNQLGAANPTVIGSFAAGHVAMGINIQNAALYNSFDGLPPLKGSNGYQGTPYTRNAYYAGARLGVAITDKCKNPEAAMRIIDQLYDFETFMNGRFGPRGVVWDYPDSGAKTALGDPATWKSLPGFDNSATNTTRNDYWHDGSFWPFISADFQFAQFTGDVRDPSNYEAYLKKVTQEYSKFAADAEDFKAIWANQETIVQLQTTGQVLNDFVKSAITEFITGTRNIETGWNAYINELNQLGYSDHIKRFSQIYFANTK